MTIFRKKAKTSSKPAAAATEDSPPPEHEGFRIQHAAVIAVCVAIVGGASVWALMRMEGQLLTTDRFLELPMFAFGENVPEPLQETLVEHLGDLVDEPIGAPKLCERIGQRLKENAWVDELVSVTARGDGVILIECELRQPIAVVQEGGNFLLVSEDGTRLPGRYNVDAGYPIIQGISGPMPWVGEPFDQPDVAAALQLVSLFGGQPYRDQIRAIRMHNFDGRLNRAEPHIELLTDTPGGRILWGSAPGLEVEESSTQQKLAILRHNYETTGRLDANYPVIEVATFADKFIVPSNGKGA